VTRPLAGAGSSRKQLLVAEQAHLGAHGIGNSRAGRPHQPVGVIAPGAGPGPAPGGEQRKILPGVGARRLTGGTASVTVVRPFPSGEIATVVVWSAGSVGRCGLPSKECQYNPGSADLVGPKGAVAIAELSSGLIRGYSQPNQVNKLPIKLSFSRLGESYSLFSGGLESSATATNV
jgi:hypothetical protein